MGTHTHTHTHAHAHAQPNGVSGRTASNEVSSGGRAARGPPPLTDERKHEIAAYLQELPEEHADREFLILMCVCACVSARAYILARAAGGAC